MLDIFNSDDWFDSVRWDRQPHWWWCKWILKENMEESWFS